MEAARHSHSSMPLVSRLDHLDFAMKYLEGKQHLPKWRGNCSVGGAGRQSMTMDLAVKEAYLKGSLMDRVACLEHRLFQLCLELDSSSTSATSSRTSGYASSGQGLPTFTLATFNNPNRGESLDNASRVALQAREKSQMQEQERKHSKSTKQKLGKNRADKDEKKCKSGKKKVTPKWPRLKLLGC
ncbi:hypothetical protein OIU85_029842 [Salix viminalis]|uniref:Uncharacterized protein n=1 Tax=Salix viminalis TaxID=40686 RepID=A0A9Q0QC75_SALVM|nr:hypothetical protein OIU85_029842 [Salix viminalis]